MSTLKIILTTVAASATIASTLFTTTGLELIQTLLVGLFA
jgi:hypothetical protein